MKYHFSKIVFLLLFLELMWIVEAQNTVKCEKMSTGDWVILGSVKTCWMQHATAINDHTHDFIDKRRNNWRLSLNL